jgi:hypothetical protein
MADRRGNRRGVLLWVLVAPPERLTALVGRLCPVAGDQLGPTGPIGRKLVSDLFARAHRLFSTDSLTANCVTSLRRIPVATSSRTSRLWRRSSRTPPAAGGGAGSQDKSQLTDTWSSRAPPVVRFSTTRPEIVDVEVCRTRQHADTVFDKLIDAMRDSVSLSDNIVWQ